MISFAPELKAQPEYGDYQDSRFVIANGSAWGSINPHKIAISGEDVRDFHLGINSIVVYGAIEYRGLSRALLHRSRFAYTMLFEGGGRSVRFYPDGPEAYWENS
jgi:hypothetical protein